MRFKLLQSGLTGHGKTKRMLDATRFGKLYVLDIDGKLDAALRTIPEETKKLVSSIDLSYIDHSKPVIDELKRLKALNPFPYATVAIDTITVLNALVFSGLMERSGKHEKLGRADWVAEYGPLETALDGVLNWFMRLPCNLIINAHVAQGEKEDGREALVLGGRGKFIRNTIPGRMSDSHYLYYRDGKYYVRGRNSENLPANSNFPNDFYDASGNLKVSDLSVFDKDAYRVGK